MKKFRESHLQRHAPHRWLFRHPKHPVATVNPQIQRFHRGCKPFSSEILAGVFILTRIFWFFFFPIFFFFPETFLFWLIHSHFSGIFRHNSLNTRLMYALTLFNCFKITAFIKISNFLLPSFFIRGPHSMCKTPFWLFFSGSCVLWLFLRSLLFSR